MKDVRIMGNMFPFGLMRIVIIVLAACAVSAAAEWPRWRGPAGNGISEEKDWDPKALEGQPRILWTVELGEGYSAVSVSGSRLYTVGYRDGKDTVYCLDAESGKTVWTHSYPCEKGSYAGPMATPTVEGDRVYTASRQGEVFCLNAADGAVKWRKDVAKDLQAGNPKWDFAASVLIEGDRLILNFCEAGAALNKLTGEKIWASAPGIGNYSTPVAFTRNEKRVVAMFGQKDFVVVNMEDGRKILSFSWETSYDVNAADAVMVEDKVFISSGYKKGCALLDISGDEPKAVWQNRNMSTHMNAGVYLDGCIYGIDGNAGNRMAELTCLDAGTGSVVWSERTGFSSLMIAGGRLVILNENGDLSIADASRDGYKQHSRANVFGSQKVRCWTAPVLAEGRIYCRNNVGAGELVCVDVRK